MSSNVTKGKVQEIAGRQSRAALRVTAAMRAHGWRTRYTHGQPREATGDDRREEAQEALDYARIVERDATAVRTWVEAWAKREGAE